MTIMNTDQRIRERQFGVISLHCDGALKIGDQTLTPDDTKAYCAFSICTAWPSVTAYGTAIHPGTLANSHASMLHQVFNLGHRMRAYDPDPEKKNIPHDQIIGSVVAVAFPQKPMGGWTLAREVDAAPRIQAAAVVHKLAERVPKVLGEHLAGRHKWTVSQEINYAFGESGYVLTDRSKLRGKNAELAAACTPPEFDALGLGYIPMGEAPADLVECYDWGTKRVVKPWNGSPVVLLKGGVNGRAHYQGVGLVRYGAEREAEITRLLAEDPDRLDTAVDDDGLILPVRAWVQTCAAAADALAKQFAK